MKTSLALFLLTASAGFSTISSVGPDYVAPATAVPPSYRDLPVAWKEAAPNDQVSRGAWWHVFGDADLDALQARAQSANQDLAAAAARVEQARAVAGLARSNYWPQLDLEAGHSRARSSGTTDNAAPQLQTTTERVNVGAAWELDLFGRVRRLNEAARADVAASAAAFEAVRLALSADVAVNYFSLRALDRELALVREGAALRRRALELVSARRQGGTAADLDVARAETELATVEAESFALENQRASVQDALAVLVGEPASSFALSYRADAAAAPPSVPAGLPAELLERRPDVASAERALAAANARIGVARAAFFPAISLTGGAGFASGDLDRLFQSDSRAWSIGPSVYLPIFQGGRNRANLARSQAALEESVATYRQSVLVAFREVQDGLTAARRLTDQAAAQDRSLVSARRAAGLAQTRFDAGYVNYFEVIDAQRTVLAVERASVQLAARRLNNAVALIKSLGGGWHREGPVVASLP